ncbi:hypothetical protein BVRB_027400, partial [Beta vulgaris subsp. vulgaris]
LFIADRRADSEPDCLETTMIFRNVDQDDINDQLNDEIDTMRAGETEEALDSVSETEINELVGHPDPPSSQPSLQVQLPTEENIRASILPSFHPLASPSLVKPAPISRDSEEGAISMEQIPLKRTLTLREQFQALQRLTMVEINREFSDERLQFASQLHSIREKSVSLDHLSNQVRISGLYRLLRLLTIALIQIVEFASSFQKIVELAYNQFSSLEKSSANGRKGSITSDSACLFSVNAFWSEIQ